MNTVKRTLLRVKRMKSESIKIGCVFLVFALLFLFVSVISTSVTASSLSLTAQYQPYIKLHPKDGKESIWNMTDEMAERALNIESITEYNGLITAYAMTPNMNLVSGRFAQSEDTRMRLARFLGNNNSGQNEYFLSGEFSLISGTHISADIQGAALISAEVSAINSLNIGDEIKLDISTDSVYGNPNAPPNSFYVTIAGIFEASSSLEDNASQKPECDIKGNFIFIDAFTAKQILSSVLEKPYGGYNSGILFFPSSPTDLDRQAELLLRQLEIPDEDITLVVNDGGYSKAIAPFMRMNSMLGVILTIITLAGGAITALIYYMSIRRRFREVGILISLGITKSKIILQIIIEVLIFIIPAILISTGIVAAAINSIDIYSVNLQLTLFNIAALSVYLIALLVIVIIIATIIIIKSKPRDLFSYTS